MVTAQKQDIPYLYYLYMHPSINPYLLYEWMNEEAFNEVITPLVDQGIIYLYQNPAGQNVGMVKLLRHTHRCHHIFYLGGYAVDPAFFGQGYGKAILESSIAFAWENGGTRLELSVYTGNERAINLYKAVGFEEEGILRNYCYLASENRYIDEMMMSVLK